jgi:heme o synthase
VNAVALAHPWTLSRDVLALTKPGVSALNVIMAGGGLALAGVGDEPARAALALIATAVLVGSANALNMAIEAPTDRLMPRAADRPAAAGRLSRGWVGSLSAAGAVAAVAALGLWVNAWTAGLGAAALLLYAAVYTPLKTRTAWAAVPGAVAGALPPLIGWTAGAGQPGVPGLALFALLLVWQFPHLLAISLRYEDQYADAGLWVPSMVLGPSRTRLAVFFSACATVSLGIALGGLGMAGPLYLLASFGGGAIIMGGALQGLEASVSPRWPRRMQRMTVVYLALIAVGLAADWART